MTLPESRMNRIPSIVTGEGEEGWIWRREEGDGDGGEEEGEKLGAEAERTR